ncbi:hypothetical protein E3T26_06935 [Cryobacterium sp. TMT1-21]|uniref:hypothetical protein n=1 Tax=Cryobacterium sp. TMT1-21 TaxID=1259234 RepID=UPI00106B2681|nr:hypothetical protein [Cryobacterium sp. TMT1-21]TFD15511.1 hypothetical protein E3T26_06935 [Cryobacterium sp. TMT1-21]
MQTKVNRTIKPKAIVIVGVVLLLLAGYLAFMAWTFKTTSDETRTQSTSRQSSVSQAVSPSEPVIEKAATVEVETPVVAEQPTSSPTARTAVQAPKEAVSTPASPSKWTVVMAEAGIAESDQAIVDGLVFNGSDWNLQGCACSRLMRATSNPINRFHLLNQYVIANYSTWTAAQAQAATGQW